MKGKKCRKKNCTGTYQEDSVMASVYGEYACIKCGHIYFSKSNIRLSKEVEVLVNPKNSLIEKLGVIVKFDSKINKYKVRFTYPWVGWYEYGELEVVNKISNNNRTA